MTDLTLENMQNAVDETVQDNIDAVVKRLDLTPKPEQPTLDWDNLGYGDSQRIGMFQFQMTKAVEMEDEPLAIKLIAEFEALICSLVFAVPRSWLIKSAPAEIDWSSPKTSLYYLRRDKIQDLLQFIAMGQHEVDDKAKN